MADREQRQALLWFAAGTVAGGAALALASRFLSGGSSTATNVAASPATAATAATSKPAASQLDEPQFVEPARTTGAGEHVSVGRHAHRAEKPDDPAVVAEQFSRNRMFFGDENQQKLEQSFIVVVGLGGVGSHAAHMLARAGVGRLRLVDFDNVTLSSLNRHAVATRDDVGRPKVVACAEHFADIVPTCEVDPRVEMFTADVADELLSGRPCFVVDAIDDVNTKVDLLLACSRLGLTVLSALSAGAKSDPTRLLIGDITDPSRDPLAAKLRWALRSRVVNKAASDEDNARAFRAAVEHIRVIYTSEEPAAKLADLTPEQMDAPDAYGAVPNFRIRILPVLGTMPALVGVGAASYVLCELAGKPFSPRKIEMVSHTFAHKTHNRLVRHEVKEFGNNGKDDDALPVSDEIDCTFLLEEVWRMRSAFAFQRDRATTRNITFTRFDRSKPAQPYNLVLLTDQEMRWLDRETAITGTLPAMLLQNCEAHEVDYSIYATADDDDDGGVGGDGGDAGDGPRTEAEHVNGGHAPSSASNTTQHTDQQDQQQPQQQHPPHLPNKKLKQKKQIHASLKRGVPKLATLKHVYAKLSAMEQEWTRALKK
ncbi:mitochondrion protein [Salpingoeca rosetta]|uniref:Mitochondrion protein n=1 Tax=Salpingoeca rosetta (strain ATCC 50818 / BSB-021) TaxID=946362 RepID=F2UAF6_SALR5|nr:mitochondrion protein [Salpingoeca rosetta]EGD73731.1 mitochondrion protein [Salpingoeca rosetta]|eukprot:XP_004994012.1 mitochondrion protein [Salpingoeca rosetta]